MTAVAWRRAGVMTAALSLIGAAFVTTSLATANAATPITGVDLSTYQLMGRYNLPEPTRTSAPTNSLLAQEASSVTYDWDTDTLFVVGDGGTSVVQVSKTGQLIDSETLAPGDSPQGTTFYDTEAITYVGNGQFVLGEERDQQVNLFTYQAGATLTRADVQTVKLGATIGNTGIEGFAYDPLTSTAGEPGFIGVKEIDPKGIFSTNVDFADGTATNANTAGEPTNLFDPTLVPTDDFSDIYPLSEQPSLAGTSAGQDLIIDSQQSGKLVEVDRSGNVLSTLDITDAGAPLSVPDETHEGVTMDRDGYLYTVAEDAGGDANHPQLWVYASNPTSAPRVAVTEVDPSGSSTSYAADWFELTNTGSTDIDLTGWKMDDSSDAFSSAVALHGLATLPAGRSAVFLEDTSGTDATIASAFSQAWYGSATPPDGFLVGFYGGSGVGLSTGGDAVNIFDGSGNHVTGVSFSTAPANATFDNSARQGAIAGPVPISEAAQDAVDGAFISPGGEVGSPDGIAPAGTTPPPSGGQVVISEVAPWASGNTSYAADWFELTNTGSTDVDLTGWKMDDNSESAGAAVSLHGVTTLPAGKSAVFVEDTSASDDSLTTAFAQAWFSENALPSGFLMGFYGGSGVGLSTGGDAVTLFDGNNNLVTGVAFGPSDDTSPYQSFDNSAGVGATSLPLPIISTLSQVGADGAFASADGIEVGSPGTATVAVVTPPTTATVAVTEVAPWASGNAPYAADWFELTNTGSTDVGLAGWKMDDNSDSYSKAVTLSGVDTLPAGKSAVFFEDTDGLDATIEQGFAQAWFGTDTLPAGFLIGHYGGSGVGLSTGGDAVTIFDAAGNQVTGVQFGASPSAAPYATFDNTAGVGSTTSTLPTVSTLSQMDVDGAFLSYDGQEVGSPAGAAAPPADTTAPTVTFSGNVASYGILDTVDITCTATDDRAVVDSICPTVNAPAWTLGAGEHTLIGIATDAAGNVGTTSVTFTVTVTAADLGALTNQFVEGSAPFNTATKGAQNTVTNSIHGAINPLEHVNPNANPASKASKVATYVSFVNSLQAAGWLAPAQATALIGLANGL